MMIIEFSFREWLISLLLLFLGLYIFHRRGYRWRFLLLLSLYWLYLTFLISVAFFPIPVKDALMKQNLWRTIRHIQWRPFAYLREGRLSPRLLYAEIAGNIEATLPFGIFLPWLWPSTRKTMPWLIWLPGLGIETGQFLLSVVFGPYRTVDVSDVILNALGVASGYWLFALGELLYTRWQTPEQHS